MALLSQHKAWRYNKSLVSSDICIPRLPLNQSLLHASAPPTRGCGREQQTTAFWPVTVILNHCCHANTKIDESVIDEYNDPGLQWIFWAFAGITLFSIDLLFCIPGHQLHPFYPQANKLTPDQLLRESQHKQTLQAILYEIWCLEPCIILISNIS